MNQRWSAYGVVLILAAVAVVVSVSPGHATEEPPADRANVRLQFHVVTEEGQTVSHVGFEASSRLGSAYAFTDENGVAEVPIPIEDANRCVVWRAKIGTREQLVPDEYNRVYKTMLDLMRSASMPSFGRLVVDPAHEPHRIEIIVRPTVSVSAKLIQHDGTPTKGAMFLTGIFSMPSQANDTGIVRSNNVPRGIPARIEIFLSPQTYLVDLTAKQAQQNVDLGLVREEQLAEDCELDVKVDSSGIALIRDDGGMVLSYRVHPESRQLIESQSNHVAPRIPAGRYYVLPGIGLLDVGVLLVDRVQAGQDLSVYGIPVFIAKKGERIVAELDRPAMVEAVNKSLFDCSNENPQPLPAASDHE